MGRPRCHRRRRLTLILPLQVASNLALAALICPFMLTTLHSCFSAKKRRRAGRQPFYGTGWAGNTPFGHGQPQYNPNYQSQQQAPPPTTRPKIRAGTMEAALAAVAVVEKLKATLADDKPTSR